MADTDETAEADDSRKMDEELKTVGQIIRKLIDPQPTARRRILTYLASRFLEEQ